MKIVFIILFIVLGHSCKQKADKYCLPRELNKFVEIDTSLNYFEEKSKYRTLAFYAIEKNDNYAYNEATGFLGIHPENLEQLFFSINMAYKNNNPQAFYDCYVFTSFLIDEKDTSALRYFSLYNLAKSYELGYEFAKIGINSLKDKNGHVQKSDYFLEKFARASHR